MQKSNQIKADSPASADAVLARAQFLQIAPNATPEAVDALFASGIGRQSPITRTLHQYGITEPHVVAQFLTALSLASDEFTNFNRPIFGLSLIDWVTARAREWRDSGANEEAAEWNWVGIIDGYVGTMYAIPMIYWNDVHKRLAKVCAVLGVEDRSDEFALEDHGASEM